MRVRLTLLTLSLATLVSPVLRAQGPPVANPYKVLTVLRESVKPGRGMAHDKLEEGWVRDLAAARMPFGILALNSVTGARETWFVSPFPSYAEYTRLTKVVADNPALAAVSERLDPQETEMLSDSRSMMLQLREDLSYGAAASLPQMRFFSITRVSVKPGYVSEFEDARKLTRQAHETARVQDSYSVYQAVGGAPAGTFYIMVPRKSMGEIDNDAVIHGAEYLAALGGEEGRKRLASKARDYMAGSQTDHYAFSPKQSIVSAEWAKSDPAFWTIRTAAAAP